jgi:hypothetical protein
LSMIDSNVNSSVTFPCRDLTGSRKFVCATQLQDDLHPLHERGMCYHQLAFCVGSDFTIRFPAE